MWGPKLHVGPHLSNFCHILLPSNNTLLMALDHGVNNCEDCSWVGCPMTIHSWICHSELPSHVQIFISMFWNTHFSTLEMNWQFSSYPSGILLLAATGPTESPDWMLFNSSQNAVYPELSSWGAHCPSVGLTWGLTPCHKGCAQSHAVCSANWKWCLDVVMLALEWEAFPWGKRKENLSVKARLCSPGVNQGSFPSL